MKILFMGTPDFAVPCLDRLISDGHNVCAVFTQPDKPKGRSFSLTASPVKEFAITHNIPVYQPITLKDNATLQILEEIDPELIVVTAYGKLLPKYILDYPQYGCINIHASLLPKYRGASPIQWSIVNGETFTGVTSMYMVKEMDAGDILLKTQISIDFEDNAETLHDKLAAIGAENLSETLKLLECGKLIRTPQDDSYVTFAPILTNSNTKIDWTKSSAFVYNFVRGLNPVPMAHTTFHNKLFKILKVMPSDKSFQAICGEIIYDEGYYYVMCKNTCVLLLLLIPEGGKKMSAEDYFRGHRLSVGDRFI